MDVNEVNQMISIAKQYYELGMSQEQIANKEYISKSSVSRLLKKAVDNGYVVFQINHPIESVQILENEFYKYFNVQKVFITPAYVDDYEIRLRDTCKAVAIDLNKMVRDNEVIGVSWGRTMEYLANVLTSPLQNRKNTKVVQLNGSFAGNIMSARSSQIVEKFADVYLSQGYLLPVPGLVDTELIARTIESDSRICAVLEMANMSQLAVFGIGSVSHQSVLIERGSFTQEDYDEIIKAGAVGDICSRYFDVSGKIVCEPIDKRTIGVSLENIGKKKVSIGIAVGRNKSGAIIGALHGGIVNHLYTDEITAKEVITNYKKSYIK